MASTRVPRAFSANDRSRTTTGRAFTCCGPSCTSGAMTRSVSRFFVKTESLSTLPVRCSFLRDALIQNARYRSGIKQEIQFVDVPDGATNHNGVFPIELEGYLVGAIRGQNRARRQAENDNNR